MKHIKFYLKFIAYLSLEVPLFTAMAIGMKLYEIKADVVILMITAMFASSLVIIYISTLRLITAYLDSLKKPRV